MPSIFDSLVGWLTERWTEVVIPLVFFLATLIVTFWLRKFLYDLLDRWTRKTKWPGDEILLQATRTPSILWCLIISAYPALAISVLSAGWKDLSGKGLWTLFLISLTLTMLNLAARFTPFYGERLGAPRQTVDLIGNVFKGIILAIAIFIFLGIWGIPTTPILLLIGVAILVAALALREVISNVFAWFQLNTSQQIKEGDYIKLETGEAGYVAEISWQNIRIRSLDQGTIFIPNSKLVGSRFINYGRPVKKAKRPFRFYNRMHLKEATGLWARNLRELVNALAQVPGSVIYHHTHHFLEEHHYLTPEPSNDFAIWVGDALGDEELAERLAAVDIHDFPTIRSLRERFISIIEEHLSKGSDLRQAPPGKEFHFIKSVSIVLPTPYIAHDLREFVEALRKVSLGSLYFHIFEARLKLGKGLNDFSLWLEESLEEKELADKIAQLDPYTYTLEGLRTKLVQLIEKHF